MEQDKLIKLIQTSFKLSGLNITRKYCIQLSRQLRNIPEEDQHNWISKIVEHVLSQDLSDPSVSIDNLKLALKQCLRPSNSLQDTETVFNVIDGFKVPKIKYDLINKKFTMENNIPVEQFSEPVHKSSIFKDRLELLWYRTLKHKRFAPVKFGEMNRMTLQLRQIEYLLSSSKTNDVYIMGLLTQLTEGQYYLEDVSGAVKIDLSKADYKCDLITEGCIVLVNGNYNDGVLTVKTIGYPPAESSSQSRINFGTLNTFGGCSPVSLKMSDKLRQYEEDHAEEQIVFISELWLDNQVVLGKFKQMIEEFASCPPSVFIICGNFLSFPPNVTSAQKIKEGFKRLSSIVQSYPTVVESSKFVFIPGPYDPGAPRILPRAPLPNYVVEDFVNAIPGTILATNPCRIQYCTKEIIVMREDILTKLCRNTLHFPEDGNISRKYATSIISQSHLAPMTLPMVPIYWKHDQALQLYPTPDLIVVADQFEHYNEQYNDCQVINPGVFSKNDHPFKVWLPSQDKIEDSAMERPTENLPK